MAKATKSVIGGMTVLGMTGILCKLIGMLFNVPLAWLLNDNGMGIYQGVYPTYNLLLTISSAGLPVAVSRMVAGSLAKDDPRTAKNVLRSALLLLSGLGGFCTLLILTFSHQLTGMVNQPDSLHGFWAIAPCVLAVCVLSAFRGFMQGQQDMVPTAISQLIEQGGKVLVSLPLAWLGSQRSQAEGAAGALLGITIVEALALLYMFILYLRRRKSFEALPQQPDAPLQGRRELGSRLLLIALPITIGACIIPLAQFVDSVTLVDRMVASGLAHEEAQSMYGLFYGLVIRLINIPTALALSISMSLMPAIAHAMALGDMDDVRRQGNTGLRFSFIIGLPSAIGMSLLAEPILHFFYAGARTAEQLHTAASLLQVSALTVVLFTVVQATTSILQGIRKQWLPMLTLLLGVGLKITLNLILVSTPGINIHGGPIASIACYGSSMLLNLFFVCKYTKMRFNLMDWLLRPGAATLCMAAVVWVLRSLLPLSRLSTLLEIAVGVAVYVGAALLVKALRKQDLAALRRGRRKKK